MRKVQIVKFEEIEINTNRLDFEVAVQEKFNGVAGAYRIQYDDKIKTETYFINHYIENNIGRVDFAITKDQEKIFKSFIMSKYNLYGIYERFEAAELNFFREQERNTLLKNELNKYKNMKFWDRIKFLFSGKVE